VTDTISEIAALQQAANEFDLIVYRTLNPIPDVPLYNLIRYKDPPIRVEHLTAETLYTLLPHFKKQEVQPAILPPDLTPDYEALLEWYTQPRQTLYQESLFLLAHERATRYGFKIEPYAGLARFKLTRDGLTHATFETAEELNAFVSGYETGTMPVDVRITFHKGVASITSE
jgi:hypothetical protein